MAHCKRDAVACKATQHASCTQPLTSSALTTTNSYILAHARDPRWPCFTAAERKPIFAAQRLLSDGVQEHKGGIRGYNKEQTHHCGDELGALRPYAHALSQADAGRVRLHMPRHLLANPAASRSSSASGIGGWEAAAAAAARGERNPLPRWWSTLGQKHHALQHLVQHKKQPASQPTSQLAR